MFLTIITLVDVIATSVLLVLYLRTKSVAKQNEYFNQIYQFNSTQFLNKGKYFVTFNYNSITKANDYYCSVIQPDGIAKRIARSYDLKEIMNIARFKVEEENKESN